MPQGGRDEQSDSQFADDVLDEQYYGRPAPGVMGRTGLLLGILIGTVVAAFGAWVVLFDPLPEPSADAPVRITADIEPYKQRPDDPGGAEIPNQDRLVYDRLDRRAEGGEGVETLINRPQTPAAPEPVSEPEPAPVPQPAPIPESPVAQEQPVVEEIPEPVAVDPPVVVETPVSPQPPAQTEPETLSAPEPVVTSAPAPTGWSVQLVAMRSEQAALDAWEQFSRSHPDILGPMAPRIVAADLGERGIFYRLKAGDWQVREPADALCSALQERRVECRVTAP